MSSDESERKDADEGGFEPPAHLAGLKGMDLVRRALEEARGAAQDQGKDVGRGGNSPLRAGWSTDGGAAGLAPARTAATHNRSGRPRLIWPRTGDGRPKSPRVRCSDSGSPS